MKRTIVPFLLMALTLIFASCLKSEDEETVSYNDTAISSFSLGTLNRYVKTKAKDGVTDSTYKTTVSGSKYSFRIDHLNHKIYNPDSLPYGTDVKKVVVTVSAKNSGRMFFKSMTSDSLTIYNSSDSLDFSKPRELRVYPFSNSNANYRAYEVTVNVHQVPTDSVYWQKVTGVTPETVTTVQTGIAKNQYRVDAGNLQLSTDNGSTWTNETLDTDASYLPNNNINFVYKSIRTNKETDYVLLVGTSDADKAYASCWFKYDEYTEGAPKSGWSYITSGGRNLYPLPKLSNLSVAYYDDSNILAIGGAGMDDCSKEAYDAIYVSHDNGVSWIPNDAFRLPANLDKSASRIILKVDADRNLWLFCEGTGETWKGYFVKDDAK